MEVKYINFFSGLYTTITRKYFKQNHLEHMHLNERPKYVWFALFFYNRKPYSVISITILIHSHRQPQYISQRRPPGEKGRPDSLALLSLTAKRFTVPIVTIMAACLCVCLSQ